MSPQAPENSPHPTPWPPLIGAQGLPTFVRVRDVLLTAVAWAVLAWMLQDLWAYGLDLLTPPIWQATFTSPPDWHQMALDLRPFLEIASLLLLALLLIALRHLQARRRHHETAQPAPLPWAEHCQALPVHLDGGSERQQAAWREAAIEVEVDAAGTFHRAPTARSTAT